MSVHRILALGNKESSSLSLTKKHIFDLTFWDLECLTRVRSSEVVLQRCLVEGCAVGLRCVSWFAPNLLAQHVRSQKVLCHIYFQLKRDSSLLFPSLSETANVVRASSAGNGFLLSRKWRRPSWCLNWTQKHSFGPGKTSPPHVPP